MRTYIHIYICILACYLVYNKTFLKFSMKPRVMNIYIYIYIHLYNVPINIHTWIYIYVYIYIYKYA